MEAQTTKFCVPYTTPPILIENVPAFVCDTCGGEVFEESTSQVFARIRKGQVLNYRTRMLKVFDFEKVDEPVAVQPSYIFPLLHVYDEFGIDSSTSASGGGYILAAPGVGTLA